MRFAREGGLAVVPGAGILIAAKFSPHRAVPVARAQIRWPW